MIYIEKNSTNNIAVTLQEKSRFTAPFFLFEFIFEYDRAEGKQPIYFTSPDLSQYPNRINIFELKEGEDGDLLVSNGFEIEEGQSNLNLKRGQYIYNVYESDSITLDKSQTTGRVIETGRMVVEISTDESDKGQNNTTLNIYE